MKIALLGFGLEAKSAYNFLLKKYPNAVFEIYDQNETTKLELPPNAEIFLGVNDFSHIDADLLVRTPAVNPHELPFNANVTSVTNLFFESCGAKIIGITGSKGKGTTASFIDEILKSAGIKTHFVGNIGLPALDYVHEIQSEDIVVYEMSSFQLWDMEKSPNVSVITNIEPDHLDVHDDFDDYVQAKMNIIKHQKVGDLCVYNSENELIIDEIGNVRKESSADFRPFPDKKFANIKDKFFFWENQKLFSTKILQIPGKHNQMNALAAIDATYDILADKFNDFSQIVEVWKEGLANFTGLDHRLKFVAEKSGVKFFDDSIATTPGSAIAAIDAFSEPKILILGGSSKGADLSELIEKIANSNEKDIRKLILIGDEAEKLSKQLKEKKFDRFVDLGLKADMNEIVKTAKSLSKKGDMVILSPAHASFDMFKSYSDRGDKFIKAVNSL